MPVGSSFADVAIPNVDMWSLMLETKRDFPESQVIYKCSRNPERIYTLEQVRTAASTFGEGLYSHFSWKKGDVLLIYSPNDVDYGPVIYGTLYAGGIVSTANPGYTVDELAFQLRDTETKVLVTSESHLEKAIAAAARTNVPIENILMLGPGKSSQFLHWKQITTSGPLVGRVQIEPQEDLAFLVYSSGTTGLPKGVMLTHRNVIADLSMLTGAVGHWYSSGSDRILGVLPFFHIYGLVGLVNQCLLRGIEMIVVPDYKFEEFLGLVEKHRITFTYVAPPVVVRLAQDHLVNKYDLSSLRMITCGAAPLATEIIRKVYQRLKVGINQAYGLSETSPMTHTQPWDEWESSIGSVGKMFPNLTAKFVTTDGDEAKAGTPGELWLSGPNVFKGYWKNPSATAASVAEQDGRRYLKTGDVGYLDKNHNFFVTDRVKDQIKYKGFQVAPNELEGKLSDHPLVHDIAVIGSYDSVAHTEVPRAYIVNRARGGEGCDQATGVPEDEQSLRDAAEIVQWFAKRVANHKQLRGGIRFVNQIPKSAAGKILKNELKQMTKLESVRERPRL
ncbi:hypothetical protein H2204_009950 [Knufia peltigerae]|uniref:4-coumarate--CoA ligase n=1 Tax=Knufia peltigerae TaxID=1002370 RepID=A0AA39CT76_9EURO|nr:hypothetical protein H2204_009950 [Knufia peltigerae]